MLERKGKVGNDLIVVGDQVVDETLAGELEIRKTQVETTTGLALTKVRTEMERVDYAKIKLQAERTERARVEVAASKEDGDDAPKQGNAPRVNRVTRFQATESVRKPEIMDVDDKYGAYFDNVPKMKAYYRDVAIPDGFTPESQQQQFMGFLSPMLTIQLKQRIETNATWSDCLNELDKIMEIRHPKIWRRLEAFTVEPNEAKRNKHSRFVASQKEKWTQADVDNKYGAYFDNVPKMKAYYRDAAIPDGFTPDSQQQQFMGFLSPTLMIQLK